MANGDDATLIPYPDREKVWDRPARQRHVFQLKKHVVHWLEMEDVLFNHDSAVLLPEIKETVLAGTAKQNQLGGLAVLRAAYLHAKHHPDQKLLITGHTDTSGESDYNVSLSMQRAKSAGHVLLGEKDPWVDVAKAKHKVMDYQHILTWVARWKAWPCDPQGIDDNHGPHTDQAIRAFQDLYGKAPFGEQIGVDGVVGTRTWGAFFHLYVLRLAELLDTDEAGLGVWRGALHWLEDGKKMVGCGEYYPIDLPGRDEYRSQINRRVELLFFDPGEEPPGGLVCHGGGTCEPAQCRIYNTRLYDYRYIVPKDLVIVKLDDHFAPSYEPIDIRYKIEGLADATITLEIRSDLAPANPLYTRELTTAEKTDGIYTIQWDGKANGGGDELKDRFIHPLYAPYKVRLTDGGLYADSREFQVFYHSIELRQGPWTPDEAEPPEAEEKKWVAWHLNRLGWFGGPVGVDLDDYLKKAVIRYKANHKAMHRLNYSEYNDSIDATLKNALRASENPRTALTGDAFTDPAKEGLIYVEGLTYEDGEFNDGKAQKDRDRLNRPLIPVEALIKLKSKADQGVAAPQAVGPVRVNWRFTDPQEDISTQYTSTAAEPSLTRAYVEKCLKLNGGRTGGAPDNCHEDFGGIRKSGDDDKYTPFQEGEHYLPYKVEKDGGQKLLFSRACTDATKYPLRVGRAGVFFRPSRVAGDDYQLKAEIDFTGLPNKNALETTHGVTEETKRIHCDTGTFRIWREMKVATLVNWPARTGSNQWAEIETEFAKAYVKLDTAGMATKTISNVISEAAYKKLVAKNTSHKEKDVRLLANSFVGVDLPAQGNMAAGAYRTALRTFVHDDYWSKIIYPLRTMVSESIRKDLPSGYVVVNFMTHVPVNIRTAPPGNNTVTPANTSFITWSSSIGLPDSVLFIDQKDPDKVYYVVAHEMGHNCWLKHWEHAGGSRLQDHDQVDHNCLMSYSSSSCGHAHHVPGTYTPHFCGQCNLKLRGWDVDAGAIPADST